MTINAQIQIPIDVPEIDGDGVPYRDAIYRDYVGATTFNSHGYQAALQADIDAVLDAERQRRIERRTAPPAPVVEDPVGELESVQTEIQTLYDTVHDLEERRSTLIDTVQADPDLMEAALTNEVVSYIIAPVMGDSTPQD